MSRLQDLLIHGINQILVITNSVIDQVLDSNEVSALGLGRDLWIGQVLNVFQFYIVSDTPQFDIWLVHLRHLWHHRSILIYKCLEVALPSIVRSLVYFIIFFEASRLQLLV